MKSYERVNLHNTSGAFKSEHPGEDASDEQYGCHAVHLDVEGEGVADHLLVRFRDRNMFSRHCCFIWRGDW